VKLVAYLDCFESGSRSDELMVWEAAEEDEAHLVEVPDTVWWEYQVALQVASDAKQKLIEAAGLHFEGYVKV
jgi:hypothetical protein